MSYKPDIDKICLWDKDPFEVKYQLLINKKESAGLKHLNNSKAFIEYHYFIRKITNESLNKLHLIIHQILTLETFWIFTKPVL